MTKCNMCGRERTPQDHEYTAINAVLHGLVGWYSAEDEGPICPEDMTELMQLGNPGFSYRPDIEALS